MVKLTCFTIILLFLTFSGGNGTSYYAITAPEILRPNALYRVFVTVFEVTDPVIVEATLKPASHLINENLTAIASINSGKTEEINFQVGNWNHQLYRLEIKGSGGITFRETATVKQSFKIFSIFIQTDKGIYTPSQTVYFRIIVTKPSLLPHNPNGLVVYINDPEANRIKQWTNVTFTHGIYSGKFQLADQVNFGKWKISADFQGQTESVHFTVEEYVLPKFEVIIQLPPFVTWDDTDVTAFIEARYTYGKPVKGQLTLKVTVPFFWWTRDSEKRIAVFNTSIDGKAEVKLNIVRDLLLNQTYSFTREIKFHAKVTEALTGKQMNATNELQIHLSKYKLNFSNLNKFKPGLPYTVYLNLVLQDGTPFSDNVHLITVNCTFHKKDIWDRFSVYDHSKNVMNTMNFSVPIDGRVKIQILPPKSSKSITFKAKFLDVFTVSLARRAPMHPNSDRFIQLLPPLTVPQIGEKIELLLQSTHTLDDPLILQVMGRGKILLTNNTAGNKSKIQIIRFTVTEEMAPAVHVIIFSLTNNGLVMADSILFGVKGLFKTPVSVNVVPKSAKPGTTMEVSVKTNPHAFVALSAVDQSVLLLNKGNDLKSSRVLSKLRNIESSNALKFYDDQEGKFLDPITTLELFKDAGLLLLTNGYQMYSTPFFWNRERFPEREMPVMPGRPGVPAMDSLEITSRLSPENMPYEPPSALPMPKEPLHVRSYFPETFLWTNETASNNGTVHIKTTVPDTITSYYINAFAMDDVNGIGLAEQPAKLQIFRPFFVTLNLPYSVVRGETLALQALVFNYMTENLMVWLTLENENNEFVLINLENEMNVDENSKYIEIQVKSGEGASVFFYIVPKKIGYIDIKIAARSHIAADAIHKKLLVKAEGIPMYNSKTVLADLRKQSQFQDKIQILMPKNFVDGSERIEISATRDIMGTAINNIDQLLRMPSGCGEQNMLNFVPNIVIMDYFTATNRLTPQIEDKAIRFMESGYQRELTYKRKEGSFSAFGENDSKGSTWLTAFVVKSFIQAKKYISIDENVIRESLIWLSRQKNANHLFPEVGTVLHKEMQGGSSHGLGLTAYVLSAFLESKLNDVDSSDRFHPLIDNSINILENYLEELKTDYDLVLVTYVLHLANSSVKDVAFEKMNMRSKKDGDKMFWTMSSTSSSDDKLDPFSYKSKPKSVDIEMTSYALMTYSLRNMIAEGLPIMRWLLSKQNANGGFQSTQDTVVGIQALAQIAKEISFSDDDFHLDVKFFYEGGEKIMSLTKDNDLVLYIEQIPGNVRQIDIQASGSGFGIFQVSWSYNVLTLQENPPFEVGIEINNENNELAVEACVNASRYLYESHGETNMAVMELALPSGYVADKEHLPHVDARKLIKRVETKDGDSVVVIYFDKIGEQVCVTAMAERKIMIADVKPALVQVYDYYKPEKRGEAFYNPPALSKCEICQNEECKQTCDR
uniref:TEP1-F n=1 Tax=Scolopendra japonica TaxID=2609777 RepID=A0A0E3VMY2_9MYRI|nr:thioester-containing protein 1 [Scolopendra japonica]